MPSTDIDQPHSLAPTSPAPLNETAAAARLGLKVATLRAWLHQGRGPVFVQLGRAIRYLPDDLDEFLRSNRIAATPNER
jgi:predicted site-specific integrase-resolvase